MRVPTAEPMNFAKALIDANPNESVDVCMLGLENKTLEYGDFGTIRTVAYYGEPKTMKDEFDDDTRLIIWQGRHQANTHVPTDPNVHHAKLELVCPYQAGDYERLSLVKTWQIQMYNLISSSVIPKDCKKYFLVTDLRLPLLDLHKVDPVAVPNPLPKDIVLITQAKFHKEYAAWQEKWCNGMLFEEVDISDYMYHFKSSMYLPLHILPLMSHSQFRKSFEQKTRPAIFQVQSIRYVDDYRKKRLHEAVKFVKGHCTLHGRFRSEERGIVVATFPEYADVLLENLIDNSNNPAECFFDSAQILADHQASLVITDQRYARFGLCPNRFVEALAVNTVPLVVKGVMQYCDDTLQTVMQLLDIDPERTIVKQTTNINKPYELEFYDKDGVKLDNVLLESNMKQCRSMLSEQLMKALADFAYATVD
jgi:hypothetical protein